MNFFLNYYPRPVHSVTGWSFCGTNRWKMIAGFSWNLNYFLLPKPTNIWSFEHFSYIEMAKIAWNHWNLKKKSLSSTKWTSCSTVQCVLYSRRGRTSFAYFLYHTLTPWPCDNHTQRQKCVFFIIYSILPQKPQALLYSLNSIY